MVRPRGSVSQVVGISAPLEHHQVVHGVHQKMSRVIAVLKNLGSGNGIVGCLQVCKLARRSLMSAAACLWSAVLGALSRSGRRYPYRFGHRCLSSDMDIPRCSACIWASSHMSHLPTQLHSYLMSCHILAYLVCEAWNKVSLEYRCPEQRRISTANSKIVSIG